MKDHVYCKKLMVNMEHYLKLYIDNHNKCVAEVSACSAYNKVVWFYELIANKLKIETPSLASIG